MKTKNINKKAKLVIVNLIKGKKARNIARDTRQRRIATRKLIENSLSNGVENW